MKDICKNGYNWYQTNRGKLPHPTSGLPNYIFGYDFNTGTTSRRTQRGKHSCPTSGRLRWKDNHPCPESDQRTVMRQDGPWFSTALEPNTQINGIINLRDANGQVTEYSKLRYTCDEFPPATWVEGGDNTEGNSPSETRCAGMRCGTATKGEQDCMQFQVYFLETSRGEKKGIADSQHCRASQFPWDAA